MSYHFTSEPVEDQIVTDTTNLNRFEDEAFQQLMTLIFEFLVDPQQASQLITQLESFAAEQGVGAGALKNVVRSVVFVFKCALKKSVTPAHLRSDLALLGLSGEKADHIAELWKSNLVGLSRTAVSQTLNVNQLVDMEWRFGVTAGSSDLRKVGSTFLQVKLVVDRGTNTENIFMELTLPQFYNFLHEMEKARATLDYFS
ncbi:COMM domain-containing protein 7-like [Sycon ciliatum]|uniref:COMM domain-containing protein 7-like n=1 Tax=Sycon ciliatum TaxID=27933 RepID=UPI0020AE553E|eukprot:scpid96770/ scgid14940/ COMM domain-containing protein 7